MRPAWLLLALLALPATARADELQYLVPELAEDPFQVNPEPERFRKRISVSPAAGVLGEGRLYVLRLAYSPNTWLGYEASIGHAPGTSVDALFHMLSAIVRYPLPGRLQPYACAGYGMMLVFPGQLLNADPVTENALTLGGGLEFAIRDDFAIRGELRHVTVLGGNPQDEGTVAYRYGEATLGFAFHRKLGSNTTKNPEPPGSLPHP